MFWLRVGMVCGLAAGGAAAQTTYYVRPDGGSAKQCSGTVNAAYPGKGSNQPCAWAHPSWALEKRAWKLAGGDRLLIAPGSYRMGWGRPRHGWGDFDFNHPENVHLPPLPSGPDAKRPTIVAGEGYEQGCPQKPELWGAGPTNRILDLSGTSNAVVACLEITDHATCGSGHPTLVCGEDAPAAITGIFAKDERGENIVLRDLDIHGLAGSGITGRFGSVAMERVVLGGNGLAGWNEDLRDGAILNPVVRIEDSTIEWNGCVEEAGTRRPATGGCRGENSGGYGDGIGTAYVGGSWSIVHSVVRYNTQDGLDLLYAKEPGAKVTIDGATVYGNAGNQIKVAGEAAIRNNVIVGNCAYFDGKPFSLLKGYFREDEQGHYERGDHCRANGDALVVAAQSGTHSAILNNTIVGEGDFLIWALCQNKDVDQPCGEGTSIEIANNALRGFRRAGGFRDRKLKRSGELVAPILAEGGVVREVHHNLFFQVDRAYGDLRGQCPMAAGDICADPRFAADVLSEHFDGRLLAGSPALDHGTAVAVASDHDGAPRPQGAGYDVGAFEMRPRAAKAAGAAIRYRFDFGSGAASPGYTKVTPETRYTDERGFGIEEGSKVAAVDRGGDDRLRGDFLTSEAPPFYFSARVPEEGNYRVTVIFGDLAGASVNTVKAEARRLMVEKVATEPGRFETRSFVVNVRRPRVRGAEEIRMRGPERKWETRTWDDKITLEFTNAHPAICGVEIEKADDVPTIYLAGDSTVGDLWQEPYAAWGQMLPRFFNDGIAVANYGESEETLRSFAAENRLAKVMSVIQPGDYLLIQMGANDQKEEGEGVGPFTSYRRELKEFIAETRRHGATPVLVTPIHRWLFDADDKISNSLGKYPEAVRQTAREEHVPVIDLNAMSRVLFEAIGRQDAPHAYADTSHENDYGAYEAAKCVVEGIREAGLPVARFLLPAPRFDPARPDPWREFDLPKEPFVKVADPY